MKGFPVGELETLVARHGALIETLAARASEDRVTTEAKFMAIQTKLDDQSKKLDRLLDAQEVNAHQREETERRSEARAKRLVTWASMGSGAVVVFVSEVVRWWLRKHGA